MATNKVRPSADEAIRDVPHGATVMVGGFVGIGSPWGLLSSLLRAGTGDLTLVNTMCGPELIPLLEAGRVRKVITSFPAYASPSRLVEFERAYESGEVELELVPQGTLAERIRAGGAGIPAFFTPTGFGTEIATGKECRTFDGRECLMERGLVADFALIRAHRADRLGNLTYVRSCRNFNPVMATAAGVTIAEVDETVEPGELDPDAVVTPAIYVHRLVVRKRESDERAYARAYSTPGIPRPA